MTRARDGLHLLQPERFHVTGQARTGDRYVRVPRTRFVTDAMLGLFEVVWPAAPRTGSTEPPPSLPAVDIAAGLRDPWGGARPHPHPAPRRGGAPGPRGPP